MNVTPEKIRALHALADAYDAEQAAAAAGREARSAQMKVLRENPELKRNITYAASKPSIVRNEKVYTFAPSDQTTLGIGIAVTTLLPDDDAP